MNKTYDEIIAACQSVLKFSLNSLAVGSTVKTANLLAQRLSILSRVQIYKLEAVMQSEMRFNTIEQLIDYTYNTD